MFFFSTLRRIATLFGWTRHSTYLLSGIVLICGLVIYIWWPLAEEVLAYIDWGGAWWLTFDWLLVSIWLAMSLLILSKADLRTDARIVFVGFVGGLVIESWGTQTNLWIYYTSERPPLWILPAWPVAALATDRLTRLVRYILSRRQSWIVKMVKPSFLSNIAVATYAVVFGGFLMLMLIFIAPTFAKFLTLLATLLCALLILSPTDHRQATLVFLAGAGLGYFLEYWGTTRECWTYYTHQTPPLFAVLAHGMASVAFWRAGLVLEKLVKRVRVYQGIGER